MSESPNFDELFEEKTYHQMSIEDIQWSPGEVIVHWNDPAQWNPEEWPIIEGPY